MSAQMSFARRSGSDHCGHRGQVGAINGERPGDAKEAVRLAFQPGPLDAVTFTLTKSILLHQRERPRGERAR